MSVPQSKPNLLCSWSSWQYLASDCEALWLWSIAIHALPFTSLVRYTPYRYNQPFFLIQYFLHSRLVCHIPNLCEWLSPSPSVVHEGPVKFQGITHHDFITFHYANYSLIRNLKIQQVYHMSIADFSVRYWQLLSTADSTQNYFQVLD